MTNQYDFWMRALAGEEVGGLTLPVHEGEIHSGFFRKRTKKAGGYDAVALWRDVTGTLICLLNGRETNPQDVWPYCASHAISEQHYRDFMATGQWFDGDMSVSASLQPPPIGHNQTDPIEALKDQIESALQGVDAYAEVKDDATAAKAQSLRSRLLELSRTADKTRETEKKPFLEAGKALDAIYQPLVKSAKAGADAIAKALGAHETRKAREEAARRAAEAEEARKIALRHGPLGAENEVPEPAPAPAAAKISGAYGRAASIRTVRIAEIADQDKVYFVSKRNAEVSALLAKIAQAALNQGIILDGVTVREERKVV